MQAVEKQGPTPEWDIYNKAFLGFSEGGHGLITDALDISLSNPDGSMRGTAGHHSTKHGTSAVPT